MKVRFLKEYTAKTSTGETRTVAAGTILNLSPDKVKRLAAAGIVLDLDEAASICRWFWHTGDQVYRSSNKTPEAWVRHKKHCNAAEAFFDAGDTVSARSELEKSLAALSGSSTA
ncbi:MAG: hypothetical protein RBQ99_07310 [Trichlorobacter sp.]|jgi:hypothetical protein|nr:hypothetical protein [Trichlorobacter sp.]